MRRFVADLLTRPTQLQGGRASLDSLARDFLSALEAVDTLALERMLLDRAEFAYLYYETSALSRPPYSLSPEMMWFQMEAHSGQGKVKLLRKLGGAPVQYSGVSCADEPMPAGANRIYSDCNVRYRMAGGEEEEHRLFGAVIEREGQYKFLTYANKL